MENLFKLLEYTKTLTWEGFIKTVLFIGFLMYAGTEGREVWLDAGDSSEALGEVNRDILVTTVVPQLEAANIREAAQETEIRDLQKAFNTSTTTQALIQQKLELEVKRLEDKIDR